MMRMIDGNKVELAAAAIVDGADYGLYRATGESQSQTAAYLVVRDADTAELVGVKSYATLQAARAEFDAAAQGIVGPGLSVAV